MSNHKAMLALVATTSAALLTSYGPSRAEIVNLKADLKGSEKRRLRRAQAPELLREPTTQRRKS